MNVFMAVHVYSCLLTGIIPVQIHTGIITWNRTGIFMNIQAYSCSWNFRKPGWLEITLVQAPGESVNKVIGNPQKRVEI